jgi:uncharacterized protein (UPF0335 family)
MSVLPFKEDDDFRKHNQFAGEAAGEELRTFLGDFEAFDAQIADARSDQSDLITVMKSKGWNVKALRRLVAERKIDEIIIAILPRLRRRTGTVLWLWTVNC